MPVTPPAVAADPDAILSEYRSDPRAVHRELKKGCLLYFFLAFVLLGAGVWLLYFFSFRR